MGGFRDRQNVSCQIRSVSGLLKLGSCVPSMAVTGWASWSSCCKLHKKLCVYLYSKASNWETPKQVWLCHCLAWWPGETFISSLTYWIYSTVKMVGCTITKTSSHVAFSKKGPNGRRGAIALGVFPLYFLSYKRTIIFWVNMDCVAFVCLINFKCLWCDNCRLWISHPVFETWKLLNRPLQHCTEFSEEKVTIKISKQHRRPQNQRIHH